MTDILGRTLESVGETLLRDMRVMETKAPGKEPEGTLRVIAVREGVLVVARFRDGAPRTREDT